MSLWFAITDAVSILTKAEKYGSSKTRVIPGHVNKHGARSLTSPLICILGLIDLMCRLG